MTSSLVDRLGGLSSAVAIKGPARVATTANIVLSGLQTIDGVALAVNDRVLVKDQSAAWQNGIYRVDTGPWSRAADFNKTRDAVSGTQVYVVEGNGNAGRWFGLVSDDPISIGATDMEFALSDDVAAAEAAAAAALANANGVYDFSSRDAASGAPIPLIIDHVTVAGRSAPGDSKAATFKPVVSEPSHAGKFADASGRWFELADPIPRVDQFTGAWTAQRRMDILQARMAAGVAVKIAAYGDSTISGDNTTGHVANPTSGGNAVGNSDHNFTAPNAWPIKLQNLLRSMHGNNNIVVWNAGYGGKRLDDGWAYLNYEAAVINNPYYGAPDATIIAFGLNDQSNNNTTLLADTIAQTRRLCLKIMSRGGIPILLASDITITNGTAGRDNAKVSRQVNAAKKALAEELAIPFIDIESDEIKWVSNNKDGYRWPVVQNDYLHFGDTGHSFKAAAIARHFFKDIVALNAGERNWLEAWDNRAKGGAHTESVYLYTNNKQGGNFQYTGLTSGDALLDAWVWNEAPDMALLYRGIDTEGLTGANGLTLGNYVELYNPVTGTVTKRPGSTGFVSAGVGYRKSDLPFIFGALPYGLSRIRLRVGSGVLSGYYGCFDFMPRRRTEFQNALKGSGRFSQPFPAASGNLVFFLPEEDDASNIFGLFDTDSVNIRADLIIPVGVGFVFAHSASYGSSATAHVYGDRAFSMLYRDSTTTLRLIQGYTENGAVSFASHVAQGTIANSDAQKLRINIQRVGDDQRIRVFGDFATTTALIDKTILQSEVAFHMAGAVGGFFANTATSGAVTAEAISISLRP